VHGRLRRIEAHEVSKMNDRVREALAPMIAKWRQPFTASSYEQNQKEVALVNEWRGKCADELSAALSALSEPAPSASCSKCGATGLHACPGQKIAPWTAEERAELQRVLEGIAEPAPPDGVPY